MKNRHKLFNYSFKWSNNKSLRLKKQFAKCNIIGKNTNLLSEDNLFSSKIKAILFNTNTSLMKKHKIISNNISENDAGKGAGILY